MSATPRTDAEEEKQRKAYWMDSSVDWPTFGEVANFDLCRELETELSETTRKWRSDQSLLGGALLLLEEHGIQVGSKELIEASERAEHRLKQ